MKKIFKEIFKSSQKLRKREKEVQFGKKEFIDFLLKEEDEKRILLGKHGNRIYISFDDNGISSFLFDWFTFLKLKRENKVSEEAYNIFTKSIKDKI